MPCSTASRIAGAGAAHRFVFVRMETEDAQPFNVGKADSILSTPHSSKLLRRTGSNRHIRVLRLGLSAAAPAGHTPRYCAGASFLCMVQPSAQAFQHLFFEGKTGELLRSIRFRSMGATPGCLWGLMTTTWAMFRHPTKASRMGAAGHLQGKLAIIPANCWAQPPQPMTRCPQHLISQLPVPSQAPPSGTLLYWFYGPIYIKSFYQYIKPTIILTVSRCLC